MKIISLCGLLGYGYEEASFERICEEMDRIDIVGVDAGSVDPGPYYLGSGLSFTDRNAVKNDLARVLPVLLSHRVPLIIGTAGGAGSETHLDWCRCIIEEIAAEKGLHFRMALIKTDVTKDAVKEMLRSGRIARQQHERPLTEASVDRCTHIVSQIGTEPFIKVLAQGDADVILAGRACDTAIYAAPAIYAGFDPGLAVHMAKIMECGALCADPMTASDMMTATIKDHAFVLEPASPNRRCTVERVAAHTMYEQANPYLIHEPAGTADLSRCDYEQITDRAVEVSGSTFRPAERPTLKLEGAMLEGYRTIAIAGINDPDTIRHADMIMARVTEFVDAQISDPDEYQISLRKYGVPLPGAPLREYPENSLGIIIDVVAKTQEAANTVCALSRARFLHTDYPGRKATAGNLAFPFSPSDIACGPVYSFGIYHLAEVDDLCETAKIDYLSVGGAI
jgi:hypothetical protein